MVTVYAVPEEINVPDFDWNDLQGYREKSKKFIEELREYCLECNTEKYTGEIVRFPVADSSADYMVASIKPLELIHIPLDDAWHFQYIERMKAKDIIEKIEANKRLEKLFGGK